MSEVNDGILNRVLTKICLGGVGGVAAGGILSVVYTKPLGNTCWICFHSGMIIMGYFTIFQETTRSLRRRADPWNSWFAGSFTGLVLATPKRGIQTGIQIGILTGIAAGAFHYVYDYLLDLYVEQPATISDHKVTRESLSEMESLQTPWWEVWLPVRRISEEEAERRKSLEAQSRLHTLQMMDPPQKRTLEIQEALRKKEVNTNLGERG